MLALFCFKHKGQKEAQRKAFKTLCSFEAFVFKVFKR